MNQNEPMTPSYSWLKKVNDNVFKTESGEKTRHVKNLFHEIRPAFVITPWYKDGHYYYAKMKFLNSEGEVSKEAYRVYAPQLGDPTNPNNKPPKEFYGVLYVVWRGRWEAVEVRPSVNTYVEGDGIAMGINDPDLGGIPVVNMGITNAQIPGEIHKETKTLYFSPKLFKWVQSSLDIAGKREVALKTIAKRVVTKPPEITVSRAALQVFTGYDSSGNPKYEYRQVVTDVKITEATEEYVVVIKGAMDE